ncbi:MAG: MBOAT family protein [Candidatus Krumholzibacteriia bacterium]
MLFNSLAYLLFLATVLLLCLALPRRWHWPVLLAASYAFYMSWNPAYVLLLVFSTLTDYAVARGLATQREPASRRLLLGASLVVNLGLLFTFRYWRFFRETAQFAAGALGLHWQLPDSHLLLPVGISFYTFQTLGYSIDVWRGELPPERHLGRFALYVSFFPQLVAGPIERARRLLPQLADPPRMHWALAAEGGERILWGLFKKTVIADRLGLYVDAVYGNLARHDPASHLLATWLFALQIYCDFSAYSDIAIGSARLLGYRLEENFRRPYFSEGMVAFWRRWHISLSTWLRDYLYIPLGGSRRGEPRTLLNLGITMLLGGLWHGANWTFVIWGAYHGALLALAHLWRRARIPALPGRWLRVALTFQLVSVGWVFFRAPDLGGALRVLAGWAGARGAWGPPFVDPNTLAHAALGLALLLLVELVQERSRGETAWILGRPAWARWAASYGLVLAIVLFGVEQGAQFIYFQF